MLPDPLHPAVVHFPVVLAVLAPLLVGVVLISQRGAATRRIPWTLVVGLSALLAGSAWLATETGGDEEDVVEDVVGDAVIHEHEEAGEAVLVGSIVFALLAVAGLAPGKTGTSARYLAAVASLVVLGLGVRAGHSGGELVYVHGAGSAYTSGSGGASRGDADRHSGEEEEHEREGRGS